jgi:hypothetical protein
MDENVQIKELFHENKYVTTGHDNCYLNSGASSEI